MLQGRWRYAAAAIALLVVMQALLAPHTHSSLAAPPSLPLGAHDPAGAAASGGEAPLPTRRTGRFHRTGFASATSPPAAPTFPAGTGSQTVKFGLALLALLAFAMFLCGTSPDEALSTPVFSDTLEASARRRAKSADLTRPLHLLCLHGYLSSPAFMELQLDTVGLPNEQVSLSYLQGPHESSDTFNPMMVAKEGEMYYYWFRFDSEGMDDEVAQAKDHAMRSILAAARAGPVDGLIGFSQGGCLATEIMATVGAWRKHPSSASQAVREVLPRLPHFAVLVSAVCPNAVLASAKRAEWGEPHELPVACPSFHAIGGADQYKEESDDVFDLYDSSNATKLVHSGGHEITEREPVTSQLAMWLRTTGRRAAGLDLSD